MKYLAILISLFAMAASEADPAGILWTHPNGIGFRSGIGGLGLNSHIPTGGYPHSHGLLTRGYGLPHVLGKREAEAEPEANAYYGYYGYGRHGAINGPGYLGHTGSIHGGGYGLPGRVLGGGYGLPGHVLGKREANAGVSYEYRSPQGASGYFPYHHPYAYHGRYYG